MKDASQGPTATVVAGQADVDTARAEYPKTGAIPTKLSPALTHSPAPQNLAAMRAE